MHSSKVLIRVSQVAESNLAASSIFSISRPTLQFAEILTTSTCCIKRSRYNRSSDFLASGLESVLPDSLDSLRVFLLQTHASDYNELVSISIGLTFISKACFFGHKIFLVKFASMLNLDKESIKYSLLIVVIRLCGYVFVKQFGDVLINVLPQLKPLLSISAQV